MQKCYNEKKRKGDLSVKYKALSLFLLFCLSLFLASCTVPEEGSPSESASEIASESTSEEESSGLTPLPDIEDGGALN